MAEDGRDGDRTSGEETEAPSVEGGGEPVAPTPIFGGGATEPAGAGVEAAEAAGVETAAEGTVESVEKTEGEAEVSEWSRGRGHKGSVPVGARGKEKDCWKGVGKTS